MVCFTVFEYANSEVNLLWIKKFITPCTRKHKCTLCAPQKNYFSEVFLGTTVLPPAGSYKRHSPPYPPYSLCDDGMRVGAEAQVRGMKPALIFLLLATAALASGLLGPGPSPKQIRKRMNWDTNLQRMTRSEFSRMFRMDHLTFLYLLASHFTVSPTSASMPLLQNFP